MADQKPCPIFEPHSPHPWVEVLDPAIAPGMNQIEHHYCIPRPTPSSNAKIDQLLFKVMTLDGWQRHLLGPEGGGTLGNLDADEKAPTLFAQLTLALTQTQMQKRLTQHQVRSHIRALEHYIEASNDAKYGTLSTSLVQDYLNLIERALFPYGILEQEVS